jgi:hypothetical protein
MNNDYSKNATITLFCECEKSRLTKVFFHSLLDDLTEIVKNNENTKFQHSTGKKLEYSIAQVFTMKELPDIEYVSHGDYAILP